MSLAKFLHKFVESSLDAASGNTLILVKVKLIDGSDYEEQFVVKKQRISEIADEFSHAEDVVEVTIFEKVFYRAKTPAKPAASDDGADAVILTQAGLGALKL